MNREKRIAVAALNIAVHPHPSPKIYIDLFREAFKLKYSIPLRGEVHGILGSVRVIKEHSPEAWVTGEIFRYIKINMDEPWLDEERLVEADEDECSKIQIPNNLKPNLLKINYSFSPLKHKIFVEIFRDGSRMTPKMAEKFFLTLFNHNQLQERFNEVEVTVMPQQEVVDKIINHKFIKRLDIVVTRPNSDGLKKEEEALFQFLDSQNSKEYTMTHKSKKGAFLKLDQRTKMFGRIAARNGHLTAHVENEEGAVRPFSTKEHPDVKEKHYIPEKVHSGDVFNDIVQEFLASIDEPGPEE